MASASEPYVAKIASEPGANFVKNDYVELGYHYDVDVLYGVNFNALTNANNTDVFEASYDLYMKGNGKYGFEF